MIARLQKTMCMWIAVGALVLAPACEKNETKPVTVPTEPSQVAQKDMTDRDAAPAFTLNDHTGKPVSLSDYRGNIVVLEWINPQCPFVQHHYQDDVRTMPKLAREYADDDVVWLAINSSHFATEKDNAAFVDEKNLPYPVLDDSAGRVGQAYDAKTTPHMFVIDEDGMIAYRGAIDDNPLGRNDTTNNHVKAVIEALIADRAVPVTETKPYGCSVKYKK